MNLKKIPGFIALIMFTFSLPVKAEEAIDGNAMEIISQVTFGECVMVVFLFLTVTMYLCYLFDKYFFKATPKNPVKVISDPTDRVN